MRDDVTIDIHETGDGLREAAAAAEISGRHTVVARGDRPVAIVLSHDEYLALAETVAVAADHVLTTRIGVAERQIAGGDVYDAEDLLGK